jgi:hypothetical protein
MAGNDFSGNLWTIDTAQADAIFDDGVYIDYMKWYPNAVDNDLLVVNGEGSTIIKSRAKVPTGATNEEIGAIEFPEARGHHLGFKVTTIDGGTLYVKIR